MARTGNAPARSKTSAQPKQTPTNQTSSTIDAFLKRRARLLIASSLIPPQTRALIRYALEIKDPHLAQIVQRVEAGETTIDSLYVE